ncbi:hypothetical protein CA12_00280 [Alienimonas californiensis]|uniref:AMP-binding enzyme n=2 Tax=Alienimonas californiensis TaxID=2527989 RepID=A0A517P3K5_9PLAN|nr:hypothetical protein [Alienimonas californiensis]QDT13960.1 hypothetical protein CA12_00280 [Alienimonas californiensis]
MSAAPSVDPTTAAGPAHQVGIGVPDAVTELPSPGSPEWVHRFYFDPNSSDPAGPAPAESVEKCRAMLDAHVRAMVQWHFSPETGSPFWLEKAKTYDFDPRSITDFDGLKQFPIFEDDWLRGGPVRRWLPKGLEGKPLYVFETGGTTGTPKSRLVAEDHWIDYELFSDTLPEDKFPMGSDWLMLGPSGPRRLRLAVEHLAQYRGGLAFCVDLDPRFVVKSLKAGKADVAKDYQKHVIDQAWIVLTSGHNVKCLFTTPKLLESLAMRALDEGTSLAEMGVTGIFGGGTEFTPQWYKFATEELLEGNVYLTPTYGNTLMGLACGKPFAAEDNYKITYYAPQPRAVTEVVNFDDHTQAVDYGETGRVKLYTLTPELFIPGFLERDEGEREQPCGKYPWDGVSGVRPYHVFAKKTTVGVY